MITIIHGDDIVLSRKYLQEQKQNSINPYVFDGIIDLPSLVQITQGSGLFNTEKNIFIENFFSKNKLNTSESKNIIEYINENESSIDLFFWEGKELQKRSMALFTNPLIKKFKIPQTIFLFLESIKPGNFKASIDLFHKALQNTEPEIIFFMMQRQFRILLFVTDNKGDQIDEIARLAPWQIGKLERQARAFSEDVLLNLYSQIYKIESKLKIGSLPYSLDKAIDIFLLSI